MPENVTYDAIVVGGGVAGASAAILLARNGKNVLLLEKETTAHHKVCGEFLSFEAEGYLKDLGLDLTALGAKNIRQIRLIRGNKSIASDLPFTASSLSRFALDEALLQIAACHNVKIMRGASVHSLNQKPNIWHADTSEGEFAGKAVFLATGKHDLRGWDRPKRKHDDLIGFKMHFQLSSDQKAALSNQVDVILFKGGYAGLEPIEGDKVNLCLVVKKTRYIACGKSWDDLIKNLLLETPYLAHLKDAKACWEKPLAVYGIPYGFIYTSSLGEPSNLYRLGDQMAVIPSFCGEGMAIALHSSYKAVSAYLNENAQTYHARLKTEIFWQIKKASIISTLVSRPIGQWAIIFVSKFSCVFLRYVATKTRLKVSV